LDVDLNPAPIRPPDFGQPGLSRRASGKELFASVIAKYDTAGVDPPASVTSSAFHAHEVPAKATADAEPFAPAQPTKQTRAKIAWSDHTSLDEIDSMRAEFIGRLTEEVFPFKKNQHLSYVQFTAEERDALANFVFNSLFGTAGLNRVRAIIQAIRTTEGGTQPTLSTIRAVNLAHDTLVPGQLRGFFRFYSAFGEDLVPRRNPVAQMLRLHQRFQLYHQYETLLHHGDPETRQFLTTQGFGPSQGRGWKSMVHDYLTTVLGITHAQLANSLQENQPVHIVVKGFGLGVLVFLPGTATNL
jgi:hypothetical protein